MALLCFGFVLLYGIHKDSHPKNIKHNTHSKCIKIYHVQYDLNIIEVHTPLLSFSLHNAYYIIFGYYITKIIPL